MTLTPPERERYRRQILLADIGGQGQIALKAARVLVIGAGGLGCPILQALTVAGVGTIGVCDDDIIELSNLNRQTLYTEGDVGKPKVNAAVQRLSALNPHVKFVPFAERLTADNAPEIFASFDLIVEGVDRFETRFVINDACLQSAKPWFSSAVGKFDGQLALFDPGLEGSPCYRCLVPDVSADEAMCETDGILGTTTAILGAMTAHEVIKHICGVAPVLTGNMLIYDGKLGSVRRITLPQDPECAACRSANQA